MRLISTLLLTVMFIASGYAQKAKLHLNLEEGVSYKQLTQSKANIDQDVYGMKMNIEIIMDASMSFLVKAVSKEAYDMEISYDWMKMNMKLPQTTMEFSSEKDDESDLFSLILAEMKDMPLNLKMDKRGRIMEIEDVESRWDSIVNAFDQFPKDQREQVKSQLRNSYGGKAISGSIETYTAIFPDKAVKKGAQWNSVTNLESGMPFTLSSTFTYEGNEDGLAIITSQGKLESVDTDEFIETNGMMMKYNLSGTMNSTIKVDKKSGWIQEASTEQIVKGSSIIQANEQIPQDMTIPMTITSVTELTSE